MPYLGFSLFFLKIIWLGVQGHFHVAGVFAGGDSKKLTGPAIGTELKELLRLLVICMHFSKKPYPLFLEIMGFTSDHVLIQEGKAGVISALLLRDTPRHTGSEIISFSKHFFV